MIRRKRLLSQRLGNAALVVLLLPLVLPLALLSIALYFLYRFVLYVLMWSLWLPRGKDILFVFSDSPIWSEYMTAEVLPLVQERAVVLNWSQRRKWGRWSLPVAVFRHFGGWREYNPVILLFRPLHTARAFRFWSAFKDWKHGDQEPVRKLRQDLLSAL